MIVHLDLASVGKFDPGILAEQARCESLAPDADQQPVKAVLAFTSGVFDGYGDFVLFHFGTFDQRAQAHVQSLFFEFTRGVLGDVLVCHRQEVRQGFE